MMSGCERSWMLTEMEKSLGNCTASSTGYRRDTPGLGCLILVNLLVAMQCAGSSPTRIGPNGTTVAKIKALVGTTDNDKSVRYATKNVLGDIAS